jgi:hypothetical protein
MEFASLKLSPRRRVFVGRLVKALLILTAMVMPAGADADGTDASLLPYAVDVLDTPLSLPLHGVYLGKGLILTAAHVVHPTRSPWIRIAGEVLPSRAIKRGNFETNDLTLLQVDEEQLPISLRIRRMPICEQAPWPGEKVIVAISKATARSEVLSPLFLPPGAQRFDTVIKDVATTGNSGSGVFDLGQKCLLGIMSRKITVTVKVRERNGAWRPQQQDVAKYFVPPKIIKDFIPDGLLY